MLTLSFRWKAPVRRGVIISARHSVASNTYLVVIVAVECDSFQLNLAVTLLHALQYPHCPGEVLLTEPLHALLAKALEQTRVSRGDKT